MNLSNCCGREMPMWPESDICPACHEHCEPEEQEPTSLERYLDFRKAKREFSDKWLKEHGLNWDSFKVLESEAIAEMVSLGGTGIQIGNYFATLESRPVKIAKDAGLVIDTKHSISLHSRR